MTKKRQVVRVNEDKLKMMMAGDISMELEPGDLTIIRGEGAEVEKKELQKEEKPDNNLSADKISNEEEKNIKKRKSNKKNYHEIFLVKPDTVFRKPRTIQLEEALYFKIIKLISVPGNTISFANFINNLIINHFDVFEEEINEIYRSMIDNAYKNQ